MQRRGNEFYGTNYSLQKNMLNGANQHISFINETPEGTDSRGLRNVNDFDNHSMAEYRGGANSSSLLADNH